MTSRAPRRLGRALGAGLLLLTAALTSSAADTLPSPPPDLDRCAAMAARDLDRFLPLLSEDVAFFPDQMPVARGKEAVRTLLAPFFDAKGPAMRCEPAAVEVSRSADLAYVTGTYDVTGTAAQQSPTRGHGKYVTIWRRRPGGAWKLVLAIDNTQPPPEPDFGPPPLP